MPKILSDSGVYVENEGYEFVALIDNWHPGEPHLIAMTHIRIDRVPHLSWAKVDVWIPSSGWQPMIRLHPDVFWMDMPGFTRAVADKTESKCKQLAFRLIEELSRVASHI